MYLHVSIHVGDAECDVSTSTVIVPILSVFFYIGLVGLDQCVQTARKTSSLSTPTGLLLSSR